MGRKIAASDLPRWCLTEDDWFAAGIKRERSTSWKEFCVELDDVSYKHLAIRFDDLESGPLNDPAVYVQRQQDEIDDYSVLTPPADLAGDFDAFLKAREPPLSVGLAPHFRDFSNFAHLHRDHSA